MMAFFAMLDDYDRALLDLVQSDNQWTHARLGEAVHLSPSSVRRRLSALRERGVIRSDVSIVDADRTTVTVIVQVTFQQESVEGTHDFEQRMIAAPEVSQCYAVAGEVDFVLVVHAPDLASYEAWGKRTLMADADIRRYDTHIVWSRVKFSTAVSARALR
jgi:Lrp/AsnC family leucine-responsive transcriptional regulator